MKIHFSDQTYGHSTNWYCSITLFTYLFGKSISTQRFNTKNNMRKANESCFKLGSKLTDGVREARRSCVLSASVGLTVYLSCVPVDVIMRIVGII